MYNLFVEGDQVFNFFIDHISGETYYRKMTIDYYCYLDGMQWEIVDEYKLHQYSQKTTLYFIKAKTKSYHTLPRNLIDKDVIVAEIKFHTTVLELYGYILEFNKHTKPDYTSDLIFNLTLNSKDKLENLKINYPEKYLIYTGIEKLINTNSGYIWGDKSNGYV